MKFFIDCYPCLLQQVIKTSKLLKLNDKQTKTVLNKTMEYLLRDNQNIMPQHIVLWINNFIHENFYDDGDAFDPYSELKHNSNTLALQNFNKLEKIVVNSSSPLETAVSIAAVGNIIDFGAKEHADIDIDKEIENMDKLNFSIYDYQKLLEKIKCAAKLLYIGDNAGETVFDRVLIREIKREFPNIEIVFATREKPIINDVTIEDACFVGIDKEATVVSSGSIYPGTILEDTNREFRELFRSADVIIAKGQGNLESLGEAKNSNLFFLLRVKCDRIADILSVNNGDMILFHGSL